MTSNCRSFWHEDAREMKRSGASLREIANRFGVSRAHISNITYGVPAASGAGMHQRPTKVDVAGVQTCKLKGVMCRFDEDTFNRINIIRRARDISFSKAVHDLVSIALEEFEA